MASSDKFNKISMYTSATFENVDYIITDSYPPAYHNMFEEDSVEIISVDSQMPYTSLKG